MKQVARDSKKRIAFPTQLFAEGSTSVDIPSEIHVVPKGTWDHPLYGHIEIDDAAIDMFVEHYNAGIRKDLRVTAGHDNGMSGGELPALAWFKEPVKRPDGLWFTMEWTPLGEEAIKNRSYKYFSPEMFTNGDRAYEDPENHNVYNYVLDGGALTNFPYFKELNAAVIFSEPRLMNQFNDTMNLKDILAKKPEELSAEEKAFVVTNKGDLTDEQKTAFASVIDETPAETDEEKAAREQQELEAANVAAGLNADGTAKVTMSEKGRKVITMSEAEVTALRTAADQGAKALQKIEATERTALATKMVFSQGNQTGRFLPKQQGALEGFLATLNDKQQAQFSNLVVNMPKVAISFAEIGDGGKANDNTVTGLYSEIKNLVDSKIVASGGKLGFSEGLKQVYAEKPELKTNYEKALGESAAA